MNAKWIAPLAALGTCLVLAGCASYTQYPVTYQVPIGPPQITSDYGPQNLAVNGVQDVPVHPGTQLYYQVISPTNIVFYALDKIGPGPGGPILSQLEGTSFYSSVIPSSDKVEFLFSTTQPITGGSVQLSVSDRPMSTSAAGIPYTTPTTMGGGYGAVAQQPYVSISPTSTSISMGQSVTFTASGGAGTGSFVWGGAAPASGWSNMYTFNAPGTYTVTLYRAGDGSYAQSNTANATVTVAAPPNAPQNGGYPAVSVTPVR